MVFDELTRGAFEKHIDQCIRDIPTLMSRFRQQEVRNLLQYKSEEDFLYGVVYGRIIFGFISPLSGRISHDDIPEMQTIILKRMREVKDAIANTG